MKHPKNFMSALFMLTWTKCDGSPGGSPKYVVMRCKSLIIKPIYQPLPTPGPLKRSPRRDKKILIEQNG